MIAASARAQVSHPSLHCWQAGQSAAPCLRRVQRRSLAADGSRMAHGRVSSKFAHKLFWLHDCRCDSVGRRVVPTDGVESCAERDVGRYCARVPACMHACMHAGMDGLQASVTRVG